MPMGQTLDAEVTLTADAVLALSAVAIGLTHTGNAATSA